MQAPSRRRSGSGARAALAWLGLLGVASGGVPAAATAAGTHMAIHMATPMATPAKLTTPVQGATLLHRLDLPRQRIDGHRPLELSALAYDEASQRLWAASDRGVLFTWRVAPERPAHWTPLRAQVLTPPAAAPIDGTPGQGLNAETLSWRGPAPGAPAGSLWLGTEHGSAAWQLDDQARAVARQPWPAGLHRSAAGAEHGIEAMAWHPRHGLLAGRQRSQRLRSADDTLRPGRREREHAVHASDGQVWRFAAAGEAVGADKGAGNDGQLKAIELLPGNALLLLERVATAGGFMPVLRWLDLDRCGGEQRCQPVRLAWHVAPTASAANYEGLACTHSGLCWLVSDGRGSDAAPTRVLVLQLRR